MAPKVATPIASWVKNLVWLAEFTCKIFLLLKLKKKKNFHFLHLKFITIIFSVSDSYIFEAEINFKVGL